MCRILMILLLCLSGQAQAGPWPRPEGEGFVAFTLEAPDTGDFYTTAYAEYGVRPNLTFGLDVGAKDNGLDKAIIFVKRPVDLMDNALLFSTELGIGMSDDKAVFRPGFHIGQAFEIGEQHGWMSLEIRAVIDAEDGDTHWSSDLTVGFGLSDRTRMMVQLRSLENPADGDDIRLGTSLIFFQRPGHHLELGLLAGLRDAKDPALKLGLWRAF